MKVKELIWQLQRFDSEAEVNINLDHCLIPEVIMFKFCRYTNNLTIVQGNCGL